MRYARRMALLAAALVTLASALALQAAAGPPNHANRLEATFAETNVSGNEPHRRPGHLPADQHRHRNGRGPRRRDGDGLGHTRPPTGRREGSWTNAGIRRIGLDGGVLVLRELVHICRTASGPIGTGTWEVDGLSSTGIFAGARGSGDARIVVATTTSTLSGSLNLAEGS